MEKRSTWRSRLFGLLAMTALLVLMGGMSVMAAGTQVVQMSSPSAGVFFYQGAWGDSATTVYHQFTVQKSCIVSVDGYKETSYGTYGMSVFLCDSRMNSLEKYSSGSYINWRSSDDAATALYPLAKGTYFIRISGVPDYRVTVSVSNTYNSKAIKDSGGASRKKAKTLKAKAVAYGIIGVGESRSRSDWYKFKVKKSKVLTLYTMARGAMTSNTAGLSFSLYGPSFPKGTAVSSLYNQNGKAHTVKKRSLGGIVGKLKVKPGTYYIKVTRSRSYKDKNRGALYYVKWK